MLKVKLYGSGGIYTGSILNPPSKLFTAGSTELLVLASPENIGEINGITFVITTSNNMRKSYKWVVCDIEVLNYQNNERYIMTKKSLTFQLKAGMNTTSAHAELDKKIRSFLFRSFHDVLHKLITYHTWTLTKHHHGTYRFHDNVLLIFLIISLIMLINYLMNLLVPLEKTEGKAFTNLGHKLPVYIFVDFLVFFIPLIFEHLLRNINVKDVILKNGGQRFPHKLPLEEYEHFCINDKFAEYLHLIFCNLGIHQCDGIYNTNSEMAINDVYTEHMKNGVRKEDMTENLISHWWLHREPNNGCCLCTFNEDLHKAETRNYFVFRNEIVPIVNLNEYAFSILSLRCYCLKSFDDNYNEFPPLLTDSYRDKIIKKFVNSIFLLLHLCREFYLNYSRTINLSSVYNTYKALVYEMLHYYIHCILRYKSNQLNSQLHIDEVVIISDADSVRRDSSPAKRKFINMVNSLTWFCSRRFQGSTRHLKETSEISELPNQCFPLFNHLDKALEILIDAVVYVVYQQKYARENEKLNASMLQEIFSYASDILETCVYIENPSEELINKIDTNISQHNFLYIHTIVQGDDPQNPNFHELQLYFQRSVHDHEVLIKNAIDTVENNIIDSFFSEALLLYLQEQFPNENVKFSAETEIKMLCEKVIAESEEEVNKENIIPMFIFARLTLFWGIAVYVQNNQNTLGDKLTGQRLLSNILSVVKTNSHLYYQLKICLLEAGICEYCSGKSELNHQWYAHYMKLFSRPFLKRRITFNILFELENKLKAAVFHCIEDIMTHSFEMQTPLVSMYYVSVVIDQQSCVVVNFVKSFVAHWLGYLDTNQSASTFTENQHKEQADQLIISEAVDDEETTSKTEEEDDIPSFMDAMEKKLNLQPGELSMLYQSTYHFFDVEIDFADFYVNYEAVFFQDDYKVLPYRAKRYLQIAIGVIIVTGFLVLSIRNSDLQGPTVKEWSLLSLIGIILHVILFEPIKVVIIVIFQIY
ncbi:uncharacterized protein LOC118764827 isoform X2 [Octopus sinensis]|nr:uncharacterized protein LOC118764827 isoform X2 [Octopus sinensis]